MYVYKSSRWTVCVHRINLAKSARIPLYEANLRVCPKISVKKQLNEAQIRQSTGHICTHTAIFQEGRTCTRPYLYRRTCICTARYATLKAWWKDASASEDGKRIGTTQKVAFDFEVCSFAPSFLNSSAPPLGLAFISFSLSHLQRHQLRNSNASLLRVRPASCMNFVNSQSLIGDIKSVPADPKRSLPFWPDSHPAMHPRPTITTSGTSPQHLFSRDPHSNFIK